jgi:hypothetical protein
MPGANISGVIPGGFCPKYKLEGALLFEFVDVAEVFDIHPAGIPAKISRSPKVSGMIILARPNRVIRQL